MSSIDRPFHRKIPDIWPKCTVHAHDARLHPGCTASLCRHRSVRNCPWHLPRTSTHLALQLRLAMQQGTGKKKKTTQNPDTKHGRTTNEREGRTEKGNFHTNSHAVLSTFHIQQIYRAARRGDKLQAFNEINLDNPIF
jgi:hypothetical protein